MAKNTGNGTRKGCVKDRTQIYNSKTRMFIKKDTKTGKFISSKATPYKGISLSAKQKEKILK